MQTISVTPHFPRFSRLWLNHSSAHLADFGTESSRSNAVTSDDVNSQYFLGMHLVVSDPQQNSASVPVEVRMNKPKKENHDPGSYMRVPVMGGSEVDS
jgi:hypothetical protein